jgi:hypothetical protein
MFNPVFTDESNAILKGRLASISEQLRNLTLSTAEDYQAEVYSAVNAVISLGEQMTPLAPVGAEGPAVVGDVSVNYTQLNNDAQDIANELLRIEDASASLFNLAATSQNQLRQLIREQLFKSNQQRYSEDFLNQNNLSGVTASLDFNAGVAGNALLDETDIQADFSAGPSSVGALDSTGSFDNLTDNKPDTAMIWNGSTLELVLTFATPEIINRVSLNLDEYTEIEIDSFTTSPDGTLVEDVLIDLGVDRILLDGTANKFSGDVIIDFPPRHIKTARIIIKDRVGVGRIAFREFGVSRRRYSSTGQLTSAAIAAPTGRVLFTTDELTTTPYTGITHQISYDGTQFTVISPGDVITLQSSPFYYRALLERSTSKFDVTQGPLIQSPLDPLASANYTVTSVTTLPLGNGVIERTVALDAVTGSVVLRDIPMPGTLEIQEGAVILSVANGDYSFANNTVSFPADVTGIVITYQTTSLGSSAIKDREEYYTALLYEVRFDKE